MRGAALILFCFIAIASGNGALAGLAAIFAALYLLLIHDDAGNSVDKRSRRR